MNIQTFYRGTKLLILLSSFVIGNTTLADQCPQKNSTGYPLQEVQYLPYHYPQVGP